MIAFSYFSRKSAVKLWPSEKISKVNGRVQQPGIQPPDYLAAAICFLSGPLAQQRLTGVPPGRQRRAWDDLAKARDMLSKVKFAERLDRAKYPDGLDIEAITPFTAWIVEEQWARINWLAAHLAARKSLSYDEVVNLIQRA
jgi:hypothetical protein